MEHAFFGVSAIVPSLLLMWYFHARDVFREPARELWMAFAGGVLIVGPVLGVAWPMQFLLDEVSTPLAYGLASAFLQAAIPEEFFKLLVLLLVARRTAFDEPMDGVIYGVAASLGFATLENIVYVVGGGLPVALMRSVTAVPSHAFLGAIMGYFVGRARFEPERRGVFLGLALAVPTVLHGVYDWPLLAAARIGQMNIQAQPLVLALLSIAPLVVAGEWICAVRLTRGLRRTQLAGIGESLRFSRGERWSTVALAVGGAVMASLGGVLTLGSFWLALAGAGGRPLGLALATVVLVGLTPSIVGVALFLWGVRRLNESRVAAAR